MKQDMSSPNQRMCDFLKDALQSGNSTWIYIPNLNLLRVVIHYGEKACYQDFSTKEEAKKELEAYMDIWDTAITSGARRSAKITV